MSRWFRFYDTALDDPKVQRLPGELFKAWVNLLCLASRNSGRLPDLPDVSFALRISEADVESIVSKLSVAGLMDATEDGWTPHNWEKRQYKSDSSTERVREHRRNVTPTVSETLPATFPLCSVSESVNKEPQSKKVSAIDEAFGDFWSAYPKREGANPRKPAFDKFRRLQRDGVHSADMIAAAKRYRAEMAGKDAKFIAQTVTWLNQERWLDYQAPAVLTTMHPIVPPDGMEWVKFNSARWDDEQAERRRQGMVPKYAIKNSSGEEGNYFPAAKLREEAA